MTRNECDHPKNDRGFCLACYERAAAEAKKRTCRVCEKIADRRRELCNAHDAEEIKELYDFDRELPF